MFLKGEVCLEFGSDFRRARVENKEMGWQRSKEVKSNGMYRKVAIWGKWESNRRKSNYETYLESKGRRKMGKVGEYHESPALPLLRSERRVFMSLRPDWADTPVAIGGRGGFPWKLRLSCSNGVWGISPGGALGGKGGHLAVERPLLGFPYTASFTSRSASSTAWATLRIRGEHALRYAAVGTGLPVLWLAHHHS